MGTDAQGANGRWVSFYGQNEGTSPLSPAQRVMAPYDGYVEKIILRSQQAPGSTAIEIYKVGDGSASDSLSTSSTQVGSTITVDMSSAHTAYTFAGGTGFAVSAGEVFAIEIDPTTNLTNDLEGVLIMRFLVN